MKLSSIIAGLSVGVLSTHVLAADITVEITNLTHGSYFTPLLVAAHAEGTHLYEIGGSASAALQAMAEGGDVSDLEIMVTGIGGVSERANAAPIGPSVKAMVSNLDTGANTQLSITGMILPSNDGFAGLDAWTIPTTAGAYTIYLNAYDAGTEANDEIVNGGGASGAPGIPANPGGNGGTGATGVTSTEENSMIHIHRGVIGDTDAAAGTSDLDSRIHRWLNPVAKVVITVN